MRRTLRQKRTKRHDTRAQFGKFSYEEKNPLRASSAAMQRERVYSRWIGRTPLLPISTSVYYFIKVRGTDASYYSVQY